MKSLQNHNIIFCGICGKPQVISDNPEYRERFIINYKGICTGHDVLNKNPFNHIPTKKPSLDEYDLNEGNEIIADDECYFENIIELNLYADNYRDCI